MPQIKAAKKSLKSSARRRVINDRWRHQLRLALRALQDAIKNNDQAAATKAYPAAQQMIDKATKHNILHRNKAARQKSRLQKSISRLG